MSASACHPRDLPRHHIISKVYVTGSLNHVLSSE
jgi:hypothetical protein